MSQYDPKQIEEKWQKKWLDEKVFHADDNSPKPKSYEIEAFPYPSGAGLHVGHPKGYIGKDVHARHSRMVGKEVLSAMGWDAFGLPTENYAIKVGRSPKDVAKENIENFRRQLRMFGFSYDWDRELDTSSPEYYKWTQWLFVQLFKKGLAYRAKAKVNWCPKDQTVLANEQVVNGKCERCGSEIEERDMEQWFLKITDYADRLLDDLKELDWPSATIKRQQDWVGKSEGAELSFLLDFKKNPADNDRRGPNGERAALTVFTTRPDTLFGATYLVLAPEHPWVTLAIDDRHDVLLNKDEVKAYAETTSHKTDRMRQEDAKTKTGVELKGVKAINPATGEEIPMWIADYVLGSYGTGAIMAVPAHDERDFEFAKVYNLPNKRVITQATKGEVGTIEEGSVAAPDKSSFSASVSTRAAKLPRPFARSAL
jgi:leucyl-tRNA synthetase